MAALSRDSRPVSGWNSSSPVLFTLDDCVALFRTMFRLPRSYKTNFILVSFPLLFFNLTPIIFVSPPPPNPLLFQCSLLKTDSLYLRRRQSWQQLQHSNCVCVCERSERVSVCFVKEPVSAPLCLPRLLPGHRPPDPRLPIVPPAAVPEDSSASQRICPLGVRRKICTCHPSSIWRQPKK